MSYCVAHLLLVVVLLCNIIFYHYVPTSLTDIHARKKTARLKVNGAVKRGEQKNTGKATEKVNCITTRAREKNVCTKDHKIPGQKEKRGKTSGKRKPVHPNAVV